MAHGFLEDLPVDPSLSRGCSLDVCVARNRHRRGCARGVADTLNGAPALGRALKALVADLENKEAILLF